MITGLTAGICFLLGFLWSYQRPKLRAWALVKISEVAEQNLPVRILPTDIDFNLFPLGAELRGVRIQPKADFAAVMDPMEIAQISVELSVLQLIQGRLRLREVAVSGAKAFVRVPKTEKSTTPPLKGLFKFLGELPLNRVRLSAIDLKLYVADPHLNIDIRDISAAAENALQGLAVDLVVGTTHVSDLDNRADVRIEASTSLLLKPKSIAIAELKLRRGDSYVVASGALLGDTEALRFNDIHLDTRTSLHLESTRNWLVKSFPRLAKIPLLYGRLFADAKVTGLTNGRPDIEFNLSTTGLREDHFLIDRIKTAGTLHGTTLRLPHLEMNNSGLRVVAKGSEFNFSPATNGADETISVRSDIEVTHLQLREFMKTLDLPNVPTYLDGTGQFPCSGTLLPNFKLTCRGEMKAQNFIVNEAGAKTKGSIVAVPSFAAQGEFTVDPVGVSYQAELSMPKSKGRSRGRIEYKTGFKIEYEADTFAMTDLANLADLKIEGTAKLKGTTEGNSHAATMQMALEGSDMWFMDYWLGTAKANLAYKTGTITFTDMQGYYSVSRYHGDIAVNLDKKTIRSNCKVPFFDMRDLLKVFSRRVQLPIAMTGTGNAEIKSWGPLAFNRLSYDLKSTLFRGSVSRELFDEAHFDVHSRGGEVTADRVILKRGESTVTLTGEGHPNGDIKTVVRGRGIHLEESANVQAIGMNISGQVDFDMDLTGYVLGPTTDLRGTIIKSAIGDQGVRDSNFNLKFTANTIEGGGIFMGDVVQANFVLPLNPQAPFALNLRTQEWNYAPLFAALAGPATHKDFDGRFTSKIELAARTGGFWNSSGTIGIEKFNLRRGSLQMGAPEPMRLRMVDGRLKVDKFYLEGDGTFLRMIESPSPVAKADMQVNGKVDLNLLSLALPFFEELRGIMSFAFNLRAGPQQKELLGSVYIDKGYLKLFDFPHPFEDIRGDFLFSQKRVLINSLKAQFASGRISADGSIQLSGYKNYPLQIAATVDQAKTNLPDKFQTTGSGQLFFTGSWFPFKMKGTYEIRSGMITREFGPEQGTVAAGIQRSAFLPRVLLAESFSPLDMELQINLPNPVDIKNSMIEGRLTGNLLVKGPPGRADVFGTINIERDSKILFRENVFDLTAGVVEFKNPGELNPQMYVTARSRVNEYDVNLVLQGTGKKPELSLTSTPPLSEPDIISLLAFGAPGQKIEEGGSKGQAGNIGVNIGGDIINKNPASESIKKISGIEVGVSTGYDEDNNVAVPKITASRKLNKKFGVTASRSIGQVPKTEAKARYQLSNRVSVVGSWEGQELQENVDATDKANQTQDRFGLDVEYKIEFK